MKVIELTQKDHKKYQEFVENHPLGSIHQTVEWGEFQTRLAGRDKFWCLAVENEKGAILASALVIRQTLPFKKCWLYSPRGPLADYHDQKVLELLFQKIREIGKAQNAVFFRFDPLIPEGENIAYKSLKARKAHAHYQPENTLILDLAPAEDDILKQMKPKGRYNIKVAQKHGVKICVSDGTQKDIDAFYSLLQQTTDRDEFSGHNKKFYEDMISVLGHQKAKLYLAEHGDKTVAGIIATFFKDTAIYYFGASSNESRNVMAPYLLQWRAIQDAKAAGYKYYDFLGIAPQEAKNHPWAGVTDFKLKFGGKRVNYYPAQEIVCQPFWYLVIKLLKKLKLR